MSALTAVWPPETLADTSAKTRMQTVINLAISGSYAPGACICGKDDCACMEDTRKALDIALRAIDRAPDGSGMLAIYAECWFRAAGIPEDEWDVSIAGAEGGGH